MACARSRRATGWPARRSTKALAIDPDYAPAHAARLDRDDYDGDLAARGAALSSARWRSSPPTPTSSRNAAHVWLETWAAWTGDRAQRVRVARDPMNLVGHVQPGRTTTSTRADWTTRSRATAPR